MMKILSSSKIIALSSIKGVYHAPFKNKMKTTYTICITLWKKTRIQSMETSYEKRNNMKEKKGRIGGKKNATTKAKHLNGENPAKTKDVFTMK
jgi:hypothetical protein